MEHKISRNILALECAVAEGSAAIVRGETVVARTEAGSSPSRAEEVMLVLESLLENSSLAIDDIDLIAVSTGPGSYSGIRIGIATALGIKNALNIPCVGVSVLRAMAMAYRPQTDLITAIPVGKRDIAWQLFGANETSGPQLAPITEFTSHIDDRTKIFCHSALIARLGGEVRSRMIDAGTDLATMIGLAASGSEDSDLEPIYLRNRSHASGF